MREGGREGGEGRKIKREKGRENERESEIEQVSEYYYNHNCLTSSGDSYRSIALRLKIVLSISRGVKLEKVSLFSRLLLLRGRREIFLAL